jgi:hypothetical protein
MVCARTPPPSGLSINEHGGYYQDGKPFDLIKKNDVALIYETLNRQALYVAYCISIITVV